MSNQDRHFRMQDITPEDWHAKVTEEMKEQLNPDFLSPSRLAMMGNHVKQSSPKPSNIVTENVVLYKLSETETICPEFAKKMHKVSVDLLHIDFVRTPGKLVDIYSEDEVVGKIDNLSVRSVPGVGLCIIGDCTVTSMFNVMQMSLNASIGTQFVLSRKEDIRKIISIEYMVCGYDGPVPAYSHGLTESKLWSDIKKQGKGLADAAADLNNRLKITAKPSVLVGQSGFSMKSIHKEAGAISAYMAASMRNMNSTESLHKLSHSIADDPDMFDKVHVGLNPPNVLQRPYEHDFFKVNNSWDDDEFINQFDTPHASKPQSKGTDKNRTQKRKKGKAAKKARKNSRK